MNDGLIVLWIATLGMWCLTLYGMYLRGQLDALAWTKRLMNWKPPAPRPEEETDWRRILFYLVPLAIVTVVTVIITVSLIGGK